MIFAQFFDSAIGEMAIVWKEKKILFVVMPESNHKSLLASVRARTEVPKLNWAKETPAYIKSTIKKIIAHLSGKQQKFSLRDLELESITPFHKKVYECTQSISPGKILTYGEVAKNAGSPKAFRAVGQAMAKNPFPIIIPCHRVLGATGKLVGYSAPGGVFTKKKILEIESGDKSNRS